MTKVTPKLTVSAGLRWDILVPFTADNPGNITFLYVNKPNPGAIGANGPLLGAATSPGHGAEAAGYNRADIVWKNLGPRVDFACAVNPKTVLSGGYAFTFLNGGAYEYGTNKQPMIMGIFLRVSCRATRQGQTQPLMRAGTRAS